MAEHMGEQEKVTELGRYRRKQQKKFLFRHLGAFLLAVFVVLAGAFVWLNVGESGLKTYVGNVLKNIVSTNQYPISQPAGRVAATASLGNNLVLLDDGGLYVYSSKGNQMLTREHQYSNPVVCTAGKRYLLYDRGGRKLQVGDLLNNVREASFDQNILTVALSENGNYVVVTGDESYPNRVTVYNAKGEELWRWFSPQNLTAVAISPNGRVIAASSVTAENGVLTATVQLLRIDEDTIQGQMALPNDVVAHLSFLDNNSLHAVTATQVVALDNTANQLGVYSYGGRTLMYFCDIPEYGTALALAGDSQGHTTRLVTLNETAASQGEVDIADTLTDLTSSSNRVLALHGSQVESYPLNLTQGTTLTVEDGMMIQVAGRYLYALSGSEIQRLKT